MPRVWVFAGQGSYRAGAGVLDGFPELARRAGDVLGRPLRDLMGDPGPDLTLGTRHAAQFVVTALAYLDRARRSEPPEFLAGHSLGEYAALYAAGCLDFDTAVHLVRVRGDLIGDTDDGAMLAVVGWRWESLRELMAANDVRGVTMANENLPDQIVLSGPRDRVRAVSDLVRADGTGHAVSIGIDVAGHSPYLAGAADGFAAALRDVRFARPEIPVISNVTARPHRPETMAALLRRQICEPVRWWDTMCYLLARGVADVAEIGPGDVLTKLWTRARAGYDPSSRAAATSAHG